MRHGVRSPTSGNGERVRYMPTVPARRLTAGLVGLGLAATACSAPTTRIADQAPSAHSATPTPSPTTLTQEPSEVEPVVSLDSVPCPANENCPPTFELDGRAYATEYPCEWVAPDAIGDRIRTPGRGSPRLPGAVFTLEEFPTPAGVVVEDVTSECDGLTLALPLGFPDDRDTALLRAGLRCVVLADPPALDRCGRGGDAEWHLGEAWSDMGMAPFPETVTEADAAIEAGNFDWAWRTDPLEVGTRRYQEEPQVCSDSEGPCPWDLALTEESDRRAVVEGIVKPFPHVTWDIRLVIERLGEHSWWTTRMTVEPRPAE